MLSNSNPKIINPQDKFFEHLYENYHIYEIFANRAINCKGDKRGKISELLITSYIHVSKF
jgi:DNA adenine methylase